MNDLKENNVIVTGATGGIGNSIIKKYHLTILYRMIPFFVQIKQEI